MRNFQQIGRSVIYSTKGLVATSHPLASQEALSVLRMGGNAVDAAIAANAVLSVVEPQSTGIGGDCFALIYKKGWEKPVAINGSGKAAKYMDRSFFEKQNVHEIGINSVHAVTIPGSIDAWDTMREKFGSLNFDKLFASAINYARNGFPIHERVASDWEAAKERLKLHSTTKTLFLKENNEAYRSGELFRNEKLANVLEQISIKGKDVFYSGEIAQDMVNSLQKAGGLHEISDFQNQSTLIQEPIEVSYGENYRLYQCPPNNQGITALIIMKILEKLRINRFPPTSFERYHLEAEASKLAYFLRDQIVADQSKVDYHNYLDESYIQNLSNLIQVDKCLKMNDIADKIYLSPPDTVYNCFIDSDGMAVSFINSIFHPFGSCITSENTGIVFHNRGSCFNLKENHPNCVAPAKRPLHTIMPGMIFKNGKFFMAYGVMGGQYQPVGHVQFLNNFLEFGMNVQEALDFPRAFAYQDTVTLEERVEKEVEKSLQKVGHKCWRTNEPLGGGQAVGYDSKLGVFFGGSDSRKDGCALGY